jgi:hypothetical protein
MLIDHGSGPARRPSSGGIIRRTTALSSAHETTGRWPDDAAAATLPV